MLVHDLRSSTKILYLLMFLLKLSMVTFIKLNYRVVSIIDRGGWDVFWETMVSF